MNRTSWILISALAVIGILARLIEHIPNFAPIAALALVAGYYLPRRWSWVVPMLAMLVSDMVIGFYAWPVMLAVYGSFALAWLFGTLGKSANSRLALLPATLSSSVVFFLATNAAVWAFTDMYAPGTVGLLQSYVMGAPFFKWTLLSDMIYTGAFVAVIEASLFYFSKSYVSKIVRQDGYGDASR
ncbi:MAG: hypothetical protein HY461_02630 [Parcubacteria group bacterium]|nr:hypothetical protein [Parcubacteria group bacterium]